MWGLLRRVSSDGCVLRYMYTSIHFYEKVLKFSSCIFSKTQENLNISNIFTKVGKILVENFLFVPCFFCIHVFSKFYS